MCLGYFNCCLSHLKTCLIIALYNPITGDVAIQQGSLEINDNGETTQLQWVTPSGPHTALYVSQRFDPRENCMLLMGQETSSLSNDMNCILHNVTGSSSDTFNSTLGTVFSLQFYQGYDLIDERSFTIPSKRGGSSTSSGMCLVD